MATYSLPTTSAQTIRLEPQTVAVLLGGPSAEREISLASGAAVSEALRGRGHRVIEIDPQSIDIRKYDWSQIDVAFLALHGTYGEDGTIQELLDQLGVIYTGSDAEASRLGFSKSAAKERFFHWGVPTAQYVLIHESDSAQRIQQQVNTLGFPLVVKPDCQGSSLGVSIVRSPDDLARALTKCFSLDAFGLLESFVPGTEWTVGLLDDQILPPIQIESPAEFFDYDSKYLSEKTGYRFEYTVTSDVLRRVEMVAQQACRAIGTRGIARVDIIVDGAGRPWVLEVNTIPGLTDHSLVPKAAAQMGWDFGELCDRALISALQRARQHSTPQS